MNTNVEITTDDAEKMNIANVCDFTSFTTDLFVRYIQSAFGKKSEIAMKLRTTLPKSSILTPEGVDEVFRFMINLRDALTSLTDFEGGDAFEDSALDGLIRAGYSQADHQAIPAACTVSVVDNKLLCKNNDTKLSVAFMGQTGQGKSHIINRLVGYEVTKTSKCATCAKGVTTLPIKVVYGEVERFALQFRADDRHDEVFESLEAMRAAIREISTTQLEYLCAKLEVPSPFLRDNCVELLDLPGLQSNLDASFCAPFLSGRHRVDLIFQMNPARAADPSFVDRLFEAQVFNVHHPDDLPRIVQVWNDKGVARQAITVKRQLLPPEFQTGDSIEVSIRELPPYHPPQY